MNKYERNFADFAVLCALYLAVGETIKIMSDNNALFYCTSEILRLEFTLLKYYPSTIAIRRTTEIGNQYILPTLL